MKLSEIKAQQQNVAEGKVKDYLLQIAEKSSREKFIAHAAKYGMDADAAGNFWDDTHGVAESSDDIWGPQGNFAGDKHINVGSVSMKNIQAGDTVKYLDQKVKVVAMSKDRKYSRIDIPSGFGGTTKDVLTSDLKQLGQGVAEMNIGKRKPQPDTYHIVNKDGTPASLASYADKESAIKDRDAKHKDAEVRQLGPRGKVKGVAEGSDNLNYIGNCTDDDVIEHIFGDATNFAQAVEEHGDEFTIGDLVVKYDPESDVHSFYYKKQGVAEGVTSPEIKQAYNDIMKTQPGTPERKAAVRKYLKLRADALERSKQGVAEGLNEFAPPGGDDGDDGFSEETLKLMAAQWWNGDEDPGIEKTLAAAGWEIGQDEGYDNGGVFVVQAGDINGNSYISWPAEELEGLAENNLHKWFKEKWVRFGPDGKIRGDCARGDDSEGKPKCLPQAKAYALGKKGRATAAARKRRQDPNPERQGAAINVATKKKTNEQVCPECGGAMYPDTMINEKKDACYYKVKSRYKVWPSAYASGALVKCRKKGAKNWGTKSESADTLDENWSEKYKRSINCNNPKGFSQRAHCQGRKKNEAIDPAQPGTNTMSRTEMIRALHQAHGWGTAELNLASDAELKAEFSKLQNQATKEDVEYTRDPELYRSKEKARQHYTSVSPKDAFDKLTQRRLDHAEHDDRAQDKKIAELSAALSEIEAEMAKIKAAKNPQPVPEAKAKVKTWADVLQEAEQRFKHKQIMEGGNVSSKSPGWQGVPGEHEADEIDLKLHNRTFMVGKIADTLNAINNAYAKKYGAPIWNPSLINNREALSGSSIQFFDIKGISDEDFLNKLKKVKVGDIDTQVDRRIGDQLRKWLTSVIGKKIGPATFLGFNSSLSGLWLLDDPEVRVQIDFELGPYTQATDKEPAKPTEWFKFSHSSHLDDLSAGIKGVFHKWIYRALTHSQSSTKYVARVLIKSTKISPEPVTDNDFSFAVKGEQGGGLSAKYKPYIDPETGKPGIIDGIPVMQELPPKHRDYDQNLASQFKKLFGKKPTAQDSAGQQSFVGTIQLLNKYMNEEQREEIARRFLELCFSPKQGQMITVGDPVRDRDIKFAAIDAMLLGGNGVRPLKITNAKALRKQAVKMAMEYEANYNDELREADESEQPAVKAQLRKGMPHLRDLKPADFLDLIDELKTAGGKFKLQNIPLNVKIDGLGARFGKNAQGKPFMGTSRTEPRYTANFLDYHKEKGTTDPEMLNRAANYDKLFNEMMVAIEVIDLKLGANFLINKQVTCEVLYLPFASETPEGKLKFVGIEYDQLPQGVDLVIVPYRITDSTTGQDIPNTDAALQKIANLGQQGNTMFMSNRLVQKGALDVTEIINLVDNLDELKQIVSATAGKRDRASLALRREVETKLKSVQIALEKAIDEDPKILGKTKLGQDYEGIVINSRLGPIKVTSQRQKDIIAAKNAARASQGTQSNKTAVVAIGSFVGHKGHQQLWNYTQQRATQLGGDPYLFMGNAVGKDDPIPVADKIKTWHQMYPQYKNNISAVTQEGGTLMQKIKHELINPMPGKPPRYDNIVIMVGEDQAKMPIAQALMKAVNKFPGYEHVKVSLEATPRGTGMSFTQIRNALKQGTPAEQFNVWNNAFNDPEFGAKPLPKSWIEHLMTVSKQGMGLKEGTLKTLNQLIKEGLQALQWKN
jgi:hypothetical protein